MKTLPKFEAISIWRMLPKSKSSMYETTKQEVEVGFRFLNPFVMMVSKTSFIAIKRTGLSLGTLIGVGNAWDFCSRPL